MKGIRIMAGSLKGRVIPFVNREFDDADITPQKVKGAVFSIAGEWLHGLSFLDLYAGSGQIGFEAASRGADPVVLNEADPARHRFIRACVEDLGLASSASVLNLPAARAIELLSEKGLRFHRIFLDPPYRKSDDAPDPYRALLESISSLGLLADGGSIIVQHYSAYPLAGTAAGLSVRTARRYGKTALTVYA